MDIDPTRNVVVFQFGRDDHDRAAADAPTMDEDCVRQAWVTVQRERGARAEDVVALHTEWEPSIVDSLFIERMFPAAKVSYSFERPDPDGWEEAYEAARQTMLQRLAEERPEDGELLPVLWSASSPWAELLEAVPHRTVVAGRMYVALANVAATPRGTVGMNHLTHHRHRELGDVPFGELLADAGATLVAGLRIEGQSCAEGELLCLHRDGMPVASAVTLPDFHERMTDLVGGQRLIVGMPCPQELLVADADAGLAGEVEDAVLSSTYADSELVPSVLLVEPGGIHLVAER